MPKVTHIFTLSERLGHHVWGGAERSLRVLLPALARAGTEVEAIVLIWNDGPAVQAGLADLRAAGVQVVEIRRPVAAVWHNRVTRGLVVLLRLFPKLLQRRRRVIHLHLDFRFMPLLAFVAAMPRVAMTLHNDEPVWITPGGRLWLWALRQCIDHFVAITEQVRIHFVAAGLSPDRITTVPYGIEVWSLGGAEVRRVLGLPADAFVVGYIGRLTEQKNLATLISAASAQQDALFVLIGDGAERRDLEAQARQSRADNVRFLGARENAGELMPAFDVFCLPSKWEGLGLVLLEAMLQNVPIIGSRAGAIPEVLGEGRFGALFDCGNVGQLAGLIADARHNPAGWRERAALAKVHALANYTPAETARRTLAVYRRLAV